MTQKTNSPEWMDYAEKIRAFQNTLCRKRTEVYAHYEEQYAGIQKEACDIELMTAIGIDRYLLACRTVYLFGRRCIGKTSWALEKSKYLDCFFLTSTPTNVREAFRLSACARGRYHNRHDPNAANYIWIGTYGDLSGATKGEPIPEKKFDIVVFDDTGMTQESESIYKDITHLAKPTTVVIRIE